MARRPCYPPYRSKMSDRPNTTTVHDHVSDEPLIVAEWVREPDASFGDAVSDTASVIRAERVAPPTEVAARSWWRRGWNGVTGFFAGSFRVASLIVLLAFLAAIPIVQLITLGYLVDVSGRLAGGGKLSDGLLNLRRAGTIGLAVLAVIIAALPSQLLAHWEFVAHTVGPRFSAGNTAANRRVIAFHVGDGLLDVGMDSRRSASSLPLATADPAGT